MKKPDPDALRFAAECLRETRRALAVAAWLDQQADEDCFRATAKAVGVSTKVVRARAKAGDETLRTVREIARRSV